MANRADNHDGSCCEVKSGRHAGQWRVQFIQHDELNRKRRLSRLFGTKTEAKEFLRGLRHGVKVEAAQQRKDLTLGGWFDWLVENDWPESLADRTIGCRVGRFNTYVRPTWGDVPLIKVNPMLVRAFYRLMKEKGVGTATILEIKRDLVRVFNQAISPYARVPIMVANPFKLTVEAPPARKAVALTPEEARKALKSDKLDPERRAMLAIFLLAGVRLSEQMAMTRGQLLFDQGLIHIDRSIKVHRNGSQSTGLPKGDKVRLAVMCPSLKNLLLALTADMSDDTMLWSAATENKARMKKLVYATWRTIVKDAGLPVGMTPHDCRLTHINWIEKLMPGVSSTTLKEHVGHAALGVTEVNYTRPITPAQKILRDGIEQVICL